MELGVARRAVDMFAVTNIDDILVLALFFGQTAYHRAAVARVVAGQYLGFGAILTLSIAGALDAEPLPGAAIRYLGLLPLLLGLRAAWKALRENRSSTDDTEREKDSRLGEPAVVNVAAVTLANGGDKTGVGGMTAYAVVFLIGPTTPRTPLYGQSQVKAQGSSPSVEPVSGPGSSRCQRPARTALIQSL